MPPRWLVPDLPGHGDEMNHVSLVELSRIVEGESYEGIQLLQNPYDNPICKLSYDSDVKCIEVIWRKYATSAQLRYVHEIILAMLVQYNASKILGDDSDLPIVHAEDQRWIVDEWLPRARAAGFKVAATTISMTFFGRMAIGAIQSRLAREVRIQNFGSIHSARSWLKNLAADDSLQEP
jgi:hypothetical protein